MAWTAKITGDMTLSILDEHGVKVLGVDMLKAKTMRAGDGGDLLARTLNDLTLLAQAADAAGGECLKLRDPSAGLSPTPWSVVVQEPKRQVQVRDARGRGIADRGFPKSMSAAAFAELARQITAAVGRVNDWFPAERGDSPIRVH